MADQSGAEDQLVQLVSAAIYPSGPAAVSVCGAPCRIYRGWPNPAALDADLAAGRVNVSVFPAEGGQRLTTRYPSEWKIVATPQPSLTALVAGSVATFSGTAAAGQIAGIIADARSYSYRVQANDTPALVAANLAALSRQDAITLQSDAWISIPGAIKLIARVVADATAVREVRRQTMDIRISCWCPGPLIRDAAASAIDSALSGTPFFGMPDGTQARLIFQSNAVIDQAQNAALYRRDLIYSVEYATTETETQPAMLFGSGAINAATFIG